jgi:hypothetical protein
VWVLLATAVMLLVPPRRRSRPITALVFGVTGLLLLCFGGYRFVLNYLRFDDSPDRGELVEHVSSPDGRFEVRVFHWQAVLGEDGWDFVVQRRDAVRGVHAYAGCVFRKDYGEIKSVEAGSVHIDFDGDPIDIAFDPRDHAGHPAHPRKPLPRVRMTRKSVRAAERGDTPAVCKIGERGGAA